MKSFDKDLKKYAAKISLKTAERNALRERLLAYMEYHPLPHQALSAEELRRAIPSQSFTTFHFTAFHARIAGGFLAILLVIAPIAAERSVPGDVLYLVKTGFNEPLRAQLASSPYEKIQFETKLIERRIAEARVLASEGKLTEEMQTQISEDVKEHTSAVAHGLDELRAQDADSAAIAQITFGSSLEVQSAMLGAENNSTSSIDSILLAVNEAHEAAASKQEDDKPSFESLAARVEIETNRAFELFEAVKLSATAGEIRGIERRLEDINRLVADAKRRHDANPDAGTRDLARTLGHVHKLIVFMSDIDVREAVQLDNLVPVVLSDAERTVAVKEKITILSSLTEQISARLDNIRGNSLKEKVVEGLEQAESLILTAQTAVEVNDLDLAESSVKEAESMVTDLDTLTKRAETVIPQTEAEEESATTSEENTTEETTEGGTEETSTSTEEEEGV